MLIPASPDSSFNDINGKDLRAHIRPDGVSIGGVELPGYIQVNGVRVEAGDDHNTNELVVRFIVGDINIDDESLGHVDILSASSPLKAS